VKHVPPQTNWAKHEKISELSFRGEVVKTLGCASFWWDNGQAKEEVAGGRLPSLLPPLNLQKEDGMGRWYKLVTLI